MEGSFPWGLVMINFGVALGFLTLGLAAPLKYVRSLKIIVPIAVIALVLMIWGGLNLKPPKKEQKPQETGASSNIAWGFFYFPRRK